jgi:predicted phosphoribosyltransferase
MRRAANEGVIQPFHDRADAGRRLANELRDYEDRPEAIVLALPRGGVPVGFEVASALHAPLDVFVVRKLGLPWREELAMGAIAASNAGSVRVLDEDLIRVAKVTDAQLEHVTATERAELERREHQYRGDRPFPALAGRTVILVDDGLAAGATMRAAVAALRQEAPGRLVVAVPVAALETCNAFRDIADEIICAETPESFTAVGQWYDDFSPTTDEEVHELLERARTASASTAY